MDVPPPLTQTAVPSPETVAEPTLDIFFIAVGQGDATLIRAPTGETLLIDGGPPGGRLVAWWQDSGIPRPDYTLATHYDLDHIGGLVELWRDADTLPNTSDDWRPTQCWDRGRPTAAFPTTTLLAQYLAMRAGCAAPTIGHPYRFGEMTLTVLAMNGVFADQHTAPIDADDENAHSIVLIARYHDFTYLHMADLPGGGGVPPYHTIDLESHVATLSGAVDVLHVSHHGSRTGTNATLLATTRPTAAIISVGAENDFGHPHREVIERLQAAHVALYTTRNRTLRLQTNGEGFTIEEHPP